MSDKINRILKDIKRIEKAIHYISMVEVFPHPRLEDYREYCAARVNRKYPVTTIDPLRILYMMLDDKKCAYDSQLPAIDDVVGILKK